MNQSCSKDCDSSRIHVPSRALRVMETKEINNRQIGGNCSTIITMTNMKKNAAVV